MSVLSITGAQCAHILFLSLLPSNPSGSKGHQQHPSKATCHENLFLKDQDTFLCRVLIIKMVRINLNAPLQVAAGETSPLSRDTAKKTPDVP